MRWSYSGRAKQWGISLEMLPMWDLSMLRIWASPKGGTKIDVQFIEKKHGPVSNRKQSYEGKGNSKALLAYL
ncbi:LOW QUALITY PROTEIN: hypothetical protein YC2023_024272 [Brassica napus]